MLVVKLVIVADVPNPFDNLHIYSCNGSQKLNENIMWKLKKNSIVLNL